MKESSNKRELYKNALLLYIMTAAKFVLPVLVAACLTRRLGPSKYGVVTYVSAVMGYFLLLFDFGFNFSATKTISQNRDDYEVVQQTINNVFTSKILLVVLGSIILLLIIPFIDLLKEHTEFVITYFLSTAVNIFLPDFFFRGIEKMGFITLRYVVARLISTILIVLCVRNSDDILLIPLFYLTGTLVASVFSISKMKSAYSYSMHLAKWNSAFSEIKKSFIYFLSTFATTALSAFNTLIMGIVNLTSVEIAYWSVAFQVVQAIQSLYEPITSSFYPHIASTKDYRYLIKTTAILTVPVILGCVLTYFLSDFVIVILSGEEYINAAIVLRLLIPLLLFSFWAQMLGFPLLGAMGKQKQVTLSTIIAAIIHILLVIVLIALNSFTLKNLSIMRDFSELILFITRFLFTFAMIKEIKNASN